MCLFGATYGHFGQLFILSGHTGCHSKQTDSAEFFTLTMHWVMYLGKELILVTLSNNSPHVT